jgi:hypothetical protein
MGCKYIFDYLVVEFIGCIFAEDRPIDQFNRITGIITNKLVSVVLKHPLKHQLMLFLIDYANSLWFLLCLSLVFCVIYRISLCSDD